MSFKSILCDENTTGSSHQCRAQNMTETPTDSVRVALLECSKSGGLWRWVGGWVGGGVCFGRSVRLKDNHWREGGGGVR